MNVSFSRRIYTTGKCKCYAESFKKKKKKTLYILWPSVKEGGFPSEYGRVEKASLAAGGKNRAGGGGAGSPAEGPRRAQTCAGLCPPSPPTSAVCLSERPICRKTGRQTGVGGGGRASNVNVIQIYGRQRERRLLGLRRTRYCLCHWNAHRQKKTTTKKTEKRLPPRLRGTPKEKEARKRNKKK